MVDALNLQAGTALYPCPDGLTKLMGCDWGRDFKQTRQPWDDLWPGLPEIRLTRSSAGARMLFLTPAPTALQINMLGSACPYRYGIPHQVDADISTLLEADVPLVLVRSRAEALRELAMQHTTKPYQVRDGISSTPRNGTP
ncbi:hypothetical protein [Paludibacterium denitrificans]|uniref:Uncharacterized protein n=1 Tax=Paludibacterium denitrificans TaxID=2675226 RepID=A0A844G9F0_9NEIS|nr:hypothetical protein [Paludibacterium denitrificans]MTD32402.1 hypothetical protein [Paludibacterium denitrificans]